MTDGEDTGDVAGIGLGDMIMTLRSELLRAQSDPRSAQLAFTTGPVELELSVAITKRTGGKGGIRFWVVEAGGEHEHTGLATHSFKITLNPIDTSTGRSPLVSDETRDSASRD
jgi:Trypsin-co-occurring domain 2